ncbi:hypothetical protein MMC25_006738 [Agyrium rufum]|nr:hypothetical protein [Agyrium rufum]
METGMSWHPSNSNIRNPKRPAEDNLENAQRLAKRFHSLNLEEAHILRKAQLEKSTSSQTDDGIIVEPPPTPERRKRANAFSDTMNLDDTRDRIYIHNIDDELSDIESEEEKLIFLPDIERRITRIPKSVLVNQTAPPSNTEVVLYGVPDSLSVPPDQDVVKKAILETRERARAKQLHESGSVQATISKDQLQEIHSRNQALLYHGSHDSTFDDADAMDLG